MSAEPEPFGWLLALDLYDCEPRSLADPELLTQFCRELCGVLDMRPFGQPLIEWFGAASPKTEGYSVVQLIETSSIVGHFSPQRRSAHVDVFSCKAYDADAVESFTLSFFSAGRSEASLVVRK